MNALPAADEWSALDRERLMIGPDEFVDGRVMCFVKNRTTGRYFRLGRREATILRGMVAGESADQLSLRYRAATGQPLGPASLQDALRVFGKAGIFARDVNDAPPQNALLAPPPTIFTFQIYSWDPDPDLDRILWACRWLATPWAFAAAVLAVLAAEVLILADFSAIFRQAAAHDLATAIPRAALFVGINTAMIFAHEGAHAMLCKAFGGEVREVGFKIRYLTFTPFTRLDDVLLLENRWKRAAVFAAGPLASLSILPLAYIGWRCFPVGTLGRQAAADLLIWYNLLFLGQLVPFLQLDGYHVITQFLRMPHLRDDSYRYLYTTVRQWFGSPSPRPGRGELAAYVKPVYVCYGLSSLLITVTVLSLLITRYSHVLAAWLGPWIGYGLVAGVTAAMLARFLLQLRRLHRRAP